MEEGIDDILFNGLNEQGFIFQEKCAQVINESSEGTGWIVHTTEHPVSLKDQDTRIDIIIRDERQSDSSVFGVIECKKVNPQYNCWLFGRPLYDIPVVANAQIIKIITNRANPNVQDVNFVPIKIDFGVETFHIDNWWLQVDVNRDRAIQKRSDPEPLERAFIQVCRGVGGLLIEQKRQREKIIRDGTGEFYDISEAYFVPIVITTASLYIAQYDLSDVDIASGTIERDKLNFLGSNSLSDPVKWVMVDYGAGANTAPDELYENFEGLDPIDFEPYNRRSIFIVNSTYIPEFLNNLHL